MNYTWIIFIAVLVGYFVWSRRGTSGIQRMSASQLQERLQSDPNSIEVVDVREPGEFKGGHIARAKNIPLAGLSRKLDDLPKDKDIVFVCRSGSRSMMASRTAKKAGLLKVYNLNGGMSMWRGAVKK